MTQQSARYTILYVRILIRLSNQGVLAVMAEITYLPEVECEAVPSDLLDTEIVGVSDDSGKRQHLRVPKAFVVRAPACNRCAWKLHSLRFVSLLATIGVAVAALWFIWPHFKDSVPRGLQRPARPPGAPAFIAFPT